MKNLILLILTLFYTVKADEIMDIFQAAKKNFLVDENLKNNKEYYQLLYKDLFATRFLNINADLNFSHYNTQAVPSYNITSLKIVNDMDIFGKSKFDEEINRILIEKSVVISEKEKETLFKNLLTAYVNYCMYFELVNIQQERVKNVEEILNFVKEAVKDGRFPAVEYNNWQLKLLTEQANLLQYQKYMESYYNILKIVSGLDQIKPVEPYNLSKEDLNQIYSQKEIYLKNSPDVKIIDLDKKINEVEYRKEKNYWIPKFYLSYERQINKDPTGNGNQNVFSVGFTSNLFYGGLRYKLLSLSVKDRILNIQKFRQNLTLQQNLENLYTSVLYGIDSLKTYEKQVQVSYDVYEKYLKAYKMGVANFIVLDKYYYDYVNAKNNYVQTKYNTYMSFKLLEHLVKGDIYR
ncbi:MAG: TolC family protein [Sulfurihydrogenibium sp.]|uniref:TolC family protein n=1 Tax=Sulfurihydrogenibium sp. TaxID=2053621 RepID=UPI003D0C6E93